ncbi:MAG: hypothetical protein LBK59_03830 [Bifidobacteriaceae bacterium]|nr:hypothetical protein [Bifidobacteriaceae bacterium]
MFRVVTVCTGNVCRSPLAAALIARWAAQAGMGDRVIVTSGGTRPAVGYPMHPEAAAVARAHGASPDHTARALSTAQVRSADLILTAERAHRAVVAHLLPRAAPKVYTIREFAALAQSVSMSPLPEGTARDGGGSGDSVDSALAALDAISRRRGLGPRRTAKDDDIADPVLGNKAAFRVMELQLIDPLRQGFDALFGQDRS